MKKLFVIFSVICLVTLFTGCGKKYFLDDCGCFLNIEEAGANAEKKNQDILVLITSDGDDYSSEEFIDSVLKADDFKSTVGKKYTVFHFDYSQKAYEKTVAPATASKAEKDLADKYGDLMQAGYQFACLLDCQYTPSIFLLTKERYVISEVEYEDEIFDLDDFQNLLSEYDDSSKKINEAVAATKKGTNLEKVAAIDNFYNETPEKFRTLLIDLAKKVPSLDKENASGLCSKYYVIEAESKAITAYTAGDVPGAIQAYIAAGDNSKLNPEDKQECYYMAAYLLASAGSEDYDIILAYLNKAYEICSDSEKAPFILNAINYYKIQSDAFAAAKEQNQNQQ